MPLLDNLVGFKNREDGTRRSYASAEAVELVKRVLSCGERDINCGAPLRSGYHKGQDHQDIRSQEGLILVLGSLSRYAARRFLLKLVYCSLEDRSGNLSLVGR